MRHDHYVHIPELAELFKPLLKMLDRIHKQGVRIMAALDDLKAQLAAADAKTTEIGTTISEIAADLDDLIAKLANGQPGSTEVAEATAAATALTSRLTDTAATLATVAAKHTP